MAEMPGQAPGTYVLRFTGGGPWDALVGGIDYTPPEAFDVPALEDGEPRRGRYVRESLSELPVDEDLTDKHLARGAQYRWEADG